MLQNRTIVDKYFKNDAQNGTAKVSPSSLNRSGETAENALDLCHKSDSDHSNDKTKLSPEGFSNKRETRATSTKRKLLAKGKKEKNSKKAELAKVKKEYAGKMASTYMKACERDNRAPNVEYYEMLLKQDLQDMENNK